MLRKTLLYIITPLLLIIGAVILSAQLFSSPARFVIKNLDTEPVKVVAYWRDKTKNVGPISANTTTEFFVEDEAGMKFDVTRANGTAVSVDNIYFTSNTSITVEITRTGVEVKSDLK